MSFLSIAWQHFAHYPLVVLYNRDEFRDRPSEPLQRWQTRPVIYGGKDPKSQGTWLAISETGKFAALTDFHHAHPTPHEVTQSRGKLLMDYLKSDLDPDSFLRRTIHERQKTHPCNLILGDRHSLYYSCSVSRAEESLSPGIHSISDYFMDTPMPKCQYMKKALGKRLQDERLSEKEREELFELLARPMRFPEQDLPHRGFDPSYESEMSPLFIHQEHYGTLSSALITVDNAGHVCFSERNYQPGLPHKTHTLEFDIQTPLAGD